MDKGGVTEEVGKGKPIPDKLYYRIGEVSRIVGVEPHVLRYWESEFPVLKPSRVVSKQRLYKRKDVEMLLRIKQLLHEEKYTIAGAKKHLRQDRTALSMSARRSVIEDAFLAELHHELCEILKELQRDPG
ncbi:MAG TPA: MerR family transcriptional regulator [Syntrophobacteraceae bacterium]|jgi:DNA-binding transcriptional MerR regulator|nr:MerR family transcriptional regulator [Syntrophobacteraceae bacterium]HBZ57258.1 MerR family transcriptional regulator [Syntrophobacteraceae bacterium]